MMRMKRIDEEEREKEKEREVEEEGEVEEHQEDRPKSWRHARTYLE